VSVDKSDIAVPGRKTLKFFSGRNKMKNNVPAEREAVRLLFFRL